MKRFLHKLLGDRGERLAVRHLKQQGYRIVARQHRNRFGEVDIIALDGKQVVFIEVKTRRTTRAGQPFEAVDRAKQQKITRAALGWLKEHQRLDQPCRFDVVSIVWHDESRRPTIEHFEHAFEAPGTGDLFG